jgi:hypothetical protein
VRHYLIDFASTLGTGAEGPMANWGWEVSMDPAAVARRTLMFGATTPQYRRVTPDADMPDAGWFESEVFTANGFRPMMQNPAFQRMSVRDGYWAAKILSAFTDEHLRVAVEQGRYRDQATTDYMARTLAERRDKICRYWFDRVAPLDFFVVRGGLVIFQDLALRHELYEGAPRYRAKVRGVDANREGDGTEWIELDRTMVELGEHDTPFIEVEVQVDRGDGFGPSVTCYVATSSRRVVEMRRDRS